MVRCSATLNEDILFTSTNSIVALQLKFQIKKIVGYSRYLLKKEIDKEGNLFTLQLPKKMKNLILILSLCFVLFSCFEKEEEVTVVPQEPIEGNIMECKQVTEFITEINSHPIPREGEDRASVKKFNYKGKTTYYINPTGSYWTDDAGSIIDSNCNIFCNNSQIYAENTCSDWGQNAVFVEDVWRDNR